MMQQTQQSSLQTRLKEETQDIHTQAENHPVMKSFIDGTFKKQHLLKFLVNIRPCYDVVEQRLLQPFILDTPELKRTHNIDADIDLLKQEFTKEELKHLLVPCECTDLWIAWCWAKPLEMLKADLYVRWLADLYGGRMLAKSLGKYTNAVVFEDTKRAITEVRNILDSQKETINEDVLVDEVMNFFEFHLELFTEINND
jgi:heme oxygenase